ncbi:MAG: efflux RND transporter periplasmic adaptor subunit [Planctomycetaceae bacterium]|nr:efflux RND transporter periplasmic adaptor subunit [Planctomycetaceae bacterium]
MTQWGFPAFVCLVVATAVFTRNLWWLPLTDWISGTVESSRSVAEDDHASHDHDAEHDHGDGHAHDESSSLALSNQARLNIGLTSEYLQPIQLQTFQKTISIPSVIVERPGRTRIEVSTPLTGTVTHVHSVSGEAVQPGTLLFELRLTHEDLVKTQTEFVRTLGELDVEKRELNRLEGVVSSGAVARKLVLEREYAIDKLTALINAQRESLRLHGLSDEQIEQVAKTRSLLKSLQIFAPSTDSHGEEEFKLTGRKVVQVSHSEEPYSPLVIQDLHVKKGQSVQAGQSLCELVDLGQLFIEGRAFERDANAVTEAARRNWTVTALFESTDGYQEVENLPFAYIANRVDQNSRTLSFFVDLPNKIVRDEANSQGQRFLSWKYRPGQRLQLLVPIEEWKNQFVLPVDAVTQEGAESFVFQQNGEHFDRIPVHVKYKDQRSAVIENDGSLFPGDIVARRGAHQMQMALKNKSGGGVDPHAGHSH